MCDEMGQAYINVPLSVFSFVKYSFVLVLVLVLVLISQVCIRLALYSSVYTCLHLGWKRDRTLRTDETLARTAEH